jgi:hypothetical protein
MPLWLRDIYNLLFTTVDASGVPWTVALLIAESIVLSIAYSVFGK